MNAGVLIETNNTKILIDGIHYTKAFEWSSIDENLMHQIIYTNKDFQNINLLLFSHQHCDHFDKEKTLEYLEYNDVKKIIMCDFTNEELKKNEILEELITDFFDVGSGINFINRTNSELLVLNHLPNKEDDKYNYRSITEKSADKYLANTVKTIILQEFNDNIIISTDNAA